MAPSEAAKTATQPAGSGETTGFKTTAGTHATSRMTATFGYTTEAEQVATAFASRIKGQYVIVTGNDLDAHGPGSNTGLGMETVRCLAKEGARVVLCSRSISNGEAAAATIRASHPNVDITVMSLDLGDLETVRRFAKDYSALDRPLHLLINNAGIMACPKSTTKDGFESQLGVNHLGHFYLTNLLLPLLRKSGTPETPARVVNLSSMAQYLFAPTHGILFDDLQGEKCYSSWQRYGQSKLANILFSTQLDEREAGNNVRSVSLHPGNITSTNLGQHMGLTSYLELMRTVRKSAMAMLLQGKTIPQGAATTMVCALDPNVQFGKYYSDCQVEAKRVHEHAFDGPMAKELWRVSVEMLAVKGFIF
ncbi:Retinol dehydrogenase 12 [Kappamyces sp. JEL0829]|nr:Retinol dehydrogenase 12 [Kappamyces sp. JEL0829]